MVKMFNSKHGVCLKLLGVTIWLIRLKHVRIQYVSLISSNMPNAWQKPLSNVKSWSQMKGQGYKMT